MDKLANRLIRFRKLKKITQEELANRIGVSRTTYVNYEKDRRKPDYEILQRIADVLEVSTDTLLGRESELTSEEEQLLDDIHLPLDKLLEKYDFGMDITEAEILEAIEYIKAKRIMKGKK